MKAAWLVVALLAVPTLAVADPTPACTADPRFDKPTLSQTGTRGLGDGLLGKTAAEVVAKRGPPGCKSPALWRYWSPDTCSYEKVTVSLWWKTGKVSRVVAVKWVTGQECM